MEGTREEFIFDSPPPDVFAKLRPNLNSFVEAHQSDLRKQISYFVTIATIKEKNMILVGVEEPEKFAIREEYQGIFLLHKFLQLSEKLLNWMKIALY